MQSLTNTGFARWAGTLFLEYCPRGTKACKACWASAICGAAHSREPSSPWEMFALEEHREALIWELLLGLAIAALFLAFSWPGWL